MPCLVFNKVDVESFCDEDGGELPSIEATQAAAIRATTQCSSPSEAALARGVARPLDRPAIAWIQEGSGPDVVLLHGGLTTADDMMLGLGEALRRSARLTAFDRPGHGGETANLILAPYLDAVLLPLLWRAMFFPQPVPATFAAQFPFEVAARPAQTHADGLDALLLNAGLVCSLLHYRRCDTRVEIFGGDRDLVVNNRLHGALLSRILPNSDYQELPGLGHMIHHFAQDEIARAVKRLAGG
jgi:pimeloyl-ACP methyl ester carboxylesterase